MNLADYHGAIGPAFDFMAQAAATEPREHLRIHFLAIPNKGAKPDAGILILNVAQYGWGPLLGNVYHLTRWRATFLRDFKEHARGVFHAYQTPRTHDGPLASISVTLYPIEEEQ